MRRKRRVCFVTGTRAEFGLMRRTLEAIRSEQRLQLQVIATGMHLDPRCGRTVRDLPKLGFPPDAVIPWAGANRAIAVGSATAGLARAFERLKTDVVLVVGDRVEPFAAATAGLLTNRVVAHVHGGDRAPGMADDSLRHAITKLSHLHFAATRSSAQRLLRLGEDRFRVHTVGAPGIDGIIRDARRRQSDCPGKFVLLVLHPTSGDEALEEKRARLVLRAVQSVGIEKTVIIQPNNDPGAQGIRRCWMRRCCDPSIQMFDNIDRAHFLALLRDAVALVGNSSSGIIEAASFGTPVIDIGDRQKGREHGENVVHTDFARDAITRHLRRLWNEGTPKRHRPNNVYGGWGTGRKIAHVLATVQLDERLRRKLIVH